jgi:[NiFe] hydrogenase diaphorase moiety large subunit
VVRAIARGSVRGVPTSDPAALAAIAEILARHDRDPGRLVQILRDVMAALGHVAPATITALAAALGLPRAQVTGVVGFYGFFATEPARYRVRFSDNITDEHAGSHALCARMLAAFEVGLGQVSRDGAVIITRTSCTGLGDQGPALLVNERAIGRLTPARIGAITALLRGGAPVEAWPDNLFRIDSHVHRRDLVLGTRLSAGDAIALRAEIAASGLRGRGGAGFATATKWDACAAAPGPDRYVVCNADEGEPGTFKDRVLLADHLDLVLDGMTVAAIAVGATRGLLYLRGEYAFLIAPIEAALAARRAAGLLGASFDIALHVGAGAYVCGEESALLESLEGKRGIPRNRPPYPATHGYRQRPTVVNNVETLAAAALIAIHGGAWFRAAGTARSPGTKILSVSGDVARPGLYEYPWGVTVRQVLDDAGAVDAAAAQVGGPSGMLLAASEFGRRIAFEDVPSAGALMVFDRTRDILEVVDNFARFFAHESCGFCTPCRVGTTLNRQLMSRVVAGHGSRRDVDDLAHVSRLMQVTSHCGLGTTAGNPVLEALAKFKPAFDARVASLDARPAFDLDAALAPAREITARDDAGAHLDGDG